jgi:hypothetical protein
VSQSRLSYSLKGGFYVMNLVDLRTLPISYIVFCSVIVSSVSPICSLYVLTTYPAAPQPPFRMTSAI